ncbi:polysaccharide deacetylase family protein [Paenibacillus sediminis]|uniref:Peptidoglycan/xylan/chitin deacetylase (PgdA/CDA1 family) n=1 Tax=Paenibacillus sediminis TaxID=664909 RepID=A0ABS4GZM7_9BACL|nr:polysaccharide deacetylase family protein [Paenibacillus sediminis]MBP1935732.1 peptidoglycan/xylan/chitin deacetylase (PgdA/CDA1 family) [Paenibacillus sediminis]
MVKKTALMLAAASLIFSACGQTPSSTTVQKQTETKASPAPKSESGKQLVKATSSVIEATKSADSLPGTDSASTSVQSNDSVPIKYHLSKSYDIIPNEEGTEKKVVLLTFDDAPKEAKMLNGLIDTLDKHHAKAIFFVNGYRVKEHPELLKLIHERGQIIGNHSWDHIDLKKESPQNVKKQIEDVQKIVKDTIGTAPQFFRPPYGSGNDTVKQVVKDNDLLYMTWSNGSLDWDSKNKNKPDAIIKNVLDQLHSGSNILMHELPWTVDALDTLLTKLEAKGYSFVDPRSIQTHK